MSVQQVARDLRLSWNQCFNNCEKTSSGSCIFVKQLIAIALSNITYVRRMFPEWAYGNKVFGDFILKILIEQSGIEAVRQLIKLIKGSFDALEKKYLKKLSFAIVKDAENPEDACEVFSFTFKYTNENVSILFENKNLSLMSDNLTRCTYELLKMIFVSTELLAPLPATGFLFIKLSYYEDVTPPDYMPEGFKPTSSADFVMDKNSLRLRMGEVDTGFHQTQLFIKSSCLNSMNPQIVELMKRKMQQEYQQNLNDQKNRENNTDADDVNGIIPDSQYSQTTGQNENEVQIPDTDANHSLVFSSYNGLRCPCNTTMDGKIVMIRCAACCYLQHASCFGILDPGRLSCIFMCNQCYPLNPGTGVTDPMLLELDEESQMELCFIRCALIKCMTLKRVSVSDIAETIKVDHKTISAIFYRLLSEGFIGPVSGNFTKARVVNEEKISTEGLVRYFPRVFNEFLDLEAEKENYVDTSTKKSAPNKNSGLKKRKRAPNKTGTSKKSAPKRKSGVKKRKKEVANEDNLLV